MFDGRVTQVDAGTTVTKESIDAAAPIVREGAVAGMRPPTLPGLKSMEAAWAHFEQQGKLNSAPPAPGHGDSSEGEREHKGAEAAGSSSSSGKKSASGGDGPGIVKALPEPVGGVVAMDVSDNGVWAATGCSDGTVRLWRTEGNLERVFCLDAPVCRVRFAPLLGVGAMPQLLVATVRGEVTLFECKSGVPFFTQVCGLLLLLLMLLFHLGALLAWCGCGCPPKAHTVACLCVQNFDVEVGSVSFSSNGQAIIVGLRTNTTEQREHNVYVLCGLVRVPFRFSLVKCVLTFGFAISHCAWCVSGTPCLHSLERCATASTFPTGSPVQPLHTTAPPWPSCSQAAVCCTPSRPMGPASRPLPRQTRAMRTVSWL